MAKNSMSYDTLSAMYNRLVAAHRSLQEQIKEKEDCWAAQERQYIRTITAARALCELIVVKDTANNEFLGKSFSWSSLSADDLIARAKKTFIEYNAEQTKCINKMKEIMMAQTATIENLETQLQYNDSESEGQSVSHENREMKPKPIGQVSATKNESGQTPLNKADKAVRDAVNSGKADIEVIEEDFDGSELDDAQQFAMATAGETIAIDNGKPPIKLSQRSKQNKESVSKKMAGDILVNVEKIEESMTDRRWDVIKCIGDTGEYLPKEIYFYLYNTDYTEAQGSSKTNFKNDLHSLVMINAIKKESAINPFNPKLEVYRLTSTGAVLYERKFGKKPADSQLKQIVKDHDNLEHGIGIILLADLMRQSPMFTEVVTDRGKNTIVLKGGDTFIPDIVAKTTRYTTYFEYERGTHNQTNMSVKLNRMALATNYLNIVTPDTKSCDEVNKKVLKWIESRGGLGFLPKHTVRVTTAKRIQTVIKANGDIGKPDVWAYSYYLGAKPTT